MGKKSKNRRTGVVYSTNNDYKYTYESNQEEETLNEVDQRLYVSLDRKNRKGKDVTLVEGFVGTTEDLNALGKLLKSKCGSGGSAKNGEIIVQGNHVDKVMNLLKQMGFGQVKRKGG